MRSNRALAVLGAAVLAGGLWLAATLLHGGGAAALERDGAPAPAAAPLETARGLESTEEELPAEDEVRTAVAGADVAAPAGAPGELGELGGLVGRVVEEDGTAVYGISVALLQVDAGLLLAADWARLGEEPPRLVLDRTRTDPEGRFRLDGAYDASFQGLGIDLRGPRSTVRVVDAQLHHREVTDVGDLVLPAGCTVVGRVVDEAGTPVAGARVRIAPLPPAVPVDQLLQLGIQDFRADCAVGISKAIVEGLASPLVEPPPMVRDHLDDLPIPTTTTGEDGRYRFEAAPVGELIQGVDMPGRLGLARAVTTTPGEVVLEDATLRAGRTIAGAVVDDAGDPVQDAEVLAGSELFFGEAAILQPAGRTGPDGRFSVTGCPETGNAMAVARRSRDEPWIGEIAAAGEGIEIELEGTVQVTVRVLDAAGGVVKGAAVELAPSAEEDSPMGILARFMSLGAEPLDARFTEVEDGVYVCRDVTPGTYEVTARPRGLAAATKEVELRAGSPEVVLSCARGRTVELAVVDARTGEGVRGARATVVAAEPPFLSALAVARTGPEGRAMLGPFTDAGSAGQPGFSLMGMEAAQVLVQHPRYADGAVELPEGSATVEVALQPGGVIRGHVTWGGEPPDRVYMLVLENREGLGELLEVFVPPRLGRTDLAGAFRFTNLPAGTYRLNVFARFLDGDPLQVLFGQREPTIVHREDEVALEPAGTTEVAIDLSPSGRGQTARVAGTVTLDGQPLAGARVQVHGSGPAATATTGADGSFETGDFLARGRVRVQVTGDVPTARGNVEDVGLHTGSIEAVPRTVHRLDVAVQSTVVRVHVIAEPGGRPVAGAKVSVRSGEQSRAGYAETDAQGWTEIVLVGDGEHVVIASADGYLATSLKIDPDASDFDGSVQVELEHATRCAGVCDLDAVDVRPGETVYLSVSGHWQHLELGADRRAPFRVEGLGPGTHEAKLWVEGRETPAVSFELPEGGDEDLLLRFADAQ